MTLDEAIYSRLSGYAGLSALVSDRIYPGEIPQGDDLPAVTMQLISTYQPKASGTNPTLSRPRWRMRSWGETMASAKGVAVQVKAALGDYTGTMGGAGGVVVQRVFFDNQGYEEPLYNPETKEITEGVWQDYLIWAEE